jgi:hypothetical protein
MGRRRVSRELPDDAITRVAVRPAAASGDRRKNERASDQHGPPREDGGMKHASIMAREAADIR